MDNNTNSNGNSLIEFCQSLDLKIVNGRCGSDKRVGNLTCHKPNGSSTIDYCIVSTELLPQIREFSVGKVDKCLSDVHCPISLRLEQSNCATAYESPPDITEEPTTDHTTFKKQWIPENKFDFHNSFDSEEILLLNSEIRNLIDQQVDQNSLDNVSSKLANLFISSAQQAGMCKKPKKSKKKARKHPNKPWFNSECETQRQNYLDFKNSIPFTRDKVEREKNQAEIAKRCNIYQKFIKKQKQAYYKQLHENLRKMRTNDSKEYWKILNSGSRKLQKSGDISLTIFKNHFEQLNILHEKGQENFDPRTIEHSINEQINKDFTFSEIKEIIKKLKNNKACGVDNIVNEYLKCCPDEVICLIVDLFNLVLKTGIVPTDWCIGLIQPLYKNKGSANDPNNYRGITLLSVIGKLFTSCLNHRLGLYAENVGLLGEEQAGFREGYDTRDHIFVLNSLIP